MGSQRDGAGEYLASHIGYVVKQVQAVLRVAMDERLRPLGLGTPQYAVLSALSEETGLSGAEVARRCFVTPQTMNELIVQLELHGYIRRTRAADARVWHLALTELGTALTLQAQAQIDEVEARLIRYLPSTEQQHLLKLLRDCIHGLKES